MAYQIIYKKRVLNKVLNLLEYLNLHWGSKVTEEFLNNFASKIEAISKYPNIGSSSEKQIGIRVFLITEHNKIYYRIKGEVIEVVNIYDTRINPSKNIYKKK